VWVLLSVLGMYFGVIWRWANARNVMYCQMEGCSSVFSEGVFRALRGSQGRLMRVFPVVWMYI
jgi:hypothetical protein